MKKRLFIEALLIFLIVGGCTMFAKSAGTPRITKDELKVMLGNPDLVIIDVRTQRDWTESDSKIEGALREDPEAVESWAKKYPQGKTIVLYCA
jgi:rhodanese-related sulfurtransferase